VFGSATASQWRWVDHAGWVLCEDAVLFIAHAQGMRALRRSAADRAALERGREEVEAQVVARTRELRETAEALRRSEEETRAAMEAAEAASRAKSQFLANMSHEIRTPMSAILGYADVVGEDAMTPGERSEATGRIRTNAQHLLGIIDDVLDLSKIEAGTLRVEPVACDPRRVCDDVTGVVQERASAKGISYVLEVAPDLPRVVSDPLRLRQVLVNLVGNAVKFTTEGEVRLRAAWEPRPDGRVTLRFTVRDTGIGMTIAEVGTLFRAFSQVDSSMSRRFGGTGLGLFISRRLARMLDGDIRVTSEPGRGSEFVLEFAAPLAPSETPDALPPAPTPAGTRALAGRILVAEDGPDNQRLFEHMLRRAGAEVTVVGDGAAACDAVLSADAAGRGFDIVLMDMQMPGMDGYAATARLRASGWRGPIVALTAHAMLGDRARCLEAGCSDYLSKPVSRSLLLATCARWLDSDSRAAA
jgi:signal transduction histidine kinase/CheY-like chemotaxis protein